ncbi:MAG: HAMP domain-containing histidine kinase [Bacteroidetes bacterium]|nr:HAMP domain-containing histidine kinase [Bacteroidota bacterium]MBL0139700.1 HAMP domain-containing histidine kinase [Bacteroidota bacterium]
MNKNRIRWIIALMSIALLGIITLQVYWIMHDIQLKEQQFEQTVTQAMSAIVDRIETNEAMTILHDRIFDIDPAKISRMMMNDTMESMDQEEPIPITITDTSIEIPDMPMSPPPPIWEDLDNADINIEFHRPGSNQTFLRLQRRNFVHTDSISQHTFRSSRIMRFYGDSAEVIIKQNEEKIKARLEKLNQVMHKMAVEFAGQDDDIRKRINPKNLDSLVSYELKNRGLDIDYNFGVLNGESNAFVLTKNSSQTDDLANSKYRTLLFPNDIVAKPDFLILNFPNTIEYLLASMWLMLISSSLFTLIILFGFAYTIQVIFRQKKLSDIKTDFINNMTHEFKTPIATISLAVDSIKDPRVVANPEKMNYFTRIIREENKRMNVQVEHVLQMAQLEKGELNIRHEPVNVHDVIQKAVDLISLQVESREGQIHSQLLAEIPMVEGDPIHLSNVIFNLLDNANKYSPEKPVIEVRTENLADGLLIKVKDQGSGMTKETQKRIFEKFYRVPTGNIHDIKGFGLGLSYVKAIIEKHRGWIIVESEPNKGSTFEVFLPYK